MASFLLILMFFFTIKDTPVYILVLPTPWMMLFVWHVLKLYIMYKCRTNKIPYYRCFRSKFVNTTEYTLMVTDICMSSAHIIPIILIERMLNKYKKCIDVVPEFEYYIYESFDISSIKNMDIV